MTEQTAVITSIEVISSRGNSREQFAENFLQNQSPQLSERVLHFLGKEYRQQVWPNPEFERQAIPSKHRRRMSSLTQMVVLSGLRCIEKSGFQFQESDLGIVIGTGWGELETAQKLLLTITEEQQTNVSPTLFHNSVHNTAAGYLGIILNSKGPALTVSQSDHSFEAALDTGIMLLKMNQATAVLTGGADTLFNFSVLDQQHHQYPEAFSSGSVFFLLEPAHQARQRGANIIARCTQLPAQNLGEASQIADYATHIIEALARCQVSPAALDLAVAQEMTATPTIAESLLHHLFGEHPIPTIHSTRLSDRPTQGAESLAAIITMMQHQRVPMEIPVIPEKLDKILWFSLSPHGDCKAYLLEQ